VKKIKLKSRSISF